MLLISVFNYPELIPTFLFTSSFYLPFSLGHYCTIAEHRIFILAPPHLCQLSYGLQTPPIGPNTGRHLQKFLPSRVCIWNIILLRRVSPVVFNTSPVLNKGEDSACALLMSPVLAGGPREHPWLMSE